MWHFERYITQEIGYKLLFYVAVFKLSRITSTVLLLAHMDHQYLLKKKCLWPFFFWGDNWLLFLFESAVLLHTCVLYFWCCIDNGNINIYNVLLFLHRGSTSNHKEYNKDL